MKYYNHNVIIYLIIFVIMNGVKAQGMKKKILCRLNQQTDAKRMITCFCKCADVVHEVWPPGATACPLLTSDGGCSGDTCCGAGTIYKDGKCVLDKALVNIPIEQRKVIANLIAKSYSIEAKKVKEFLNYNY